MKKLLVSSLFVISLVLMVGCAPGSSVEVTTPSSTMQLAAPGPNPLLNQPDAQGRVARAGAGLWHGIIAPVTRPFCGACARLRITADGKVRPCLFSRDEWDVRGLMRSGADDEVVERLLLDATWSKQAGHGISATGFRQPSRPMSAIGG